MLPDYTSIAHSVFLVCFPNQCKSLITILFHSIGSTIKPLVSLWHISISRGWYLLTCILPPRFFTQRLSLWRPYFRKRLWPHTTSCLYLRGNRTHWAQPMAGKLILHRVRTHLISMFYLRGIILIPQVYRSIVQVECSQRYRTNLGENTVAAPLTGGQKWNLPAPFIVREPGTLVSSRPAEAEVAMVTGSSQRPCIIMWSAPSTQLPPL